MEKLKYNIVAILILIVMIINSSASNIVPLYADITPVDKLLQNEKIINVQDKSYYYSDIEKHWAKDGIYNLSYMEILKGFPDGTMKPNKVLTREEYIVMLVRALNLPISQSYQQYYSDVTTNQWSYKELNTAKEFGFLNLFNQSKLEPGKLITREEMAVIATNVVKDTPIIAEGKSFSDLKSDYKYLEDIKIVTALNIIKGMPDGSFKPYVGATRAEAAVIIQRLLDIKDDASTDEASSLSLIAENYEKSRISNQNQGTLNEEEILSYSIGKELKQNQLRYRIVDSLQLQNIDLYRSIDYFTASITNSTKYLAEMSVNYKLNASTEEGVSRDYNVYRKLYLMKQNEGWVVYNSTANYEIANAIKSGQKINLAWQYLSQRTPDMTSTSKIEGLNVISPTWFTLADINGGINSIGDVNYSNWAHKKGYQVWALVTNDFDKDLTSAMLSNPAARAAAVDNLIKYALAYKLDGINMDFENMYSYDKDLYTQFVKELYQKTKPMGITLSVDVTVIVSYSSWSACYDRKALAQVSDYIALMAYDQHWTGSPISGSVSELKWVEDHIKKVLLEVPKEKLLLGMPFYTRVWKEQYDSNNKLVVSSKAVSMQTADALVLENKATKTWDAVSGQYLATYQKDGATYKIWLEDESSIKLRVELANKYSLPGVASWKLGFEKASIWNVIATALNKSAAIN